MKTVLLGDQMELIGGGTPKTSNPDYWGGDIDWLSVVDFGGDSRWIERAEKKITEKGLKDSSTKLLSTGDIVISARGTVGELAQLKKPMAFNQSCYGIRAKEGLDQDYLYYLLKHSIADLQRQAHGGVFSTITRQTFQHIKIALPDRTNQEQIAKILGTIDEKIELNRRMNETLEKIGQALFKYYFLDNPEAKTWEERKLGDILDLQGGLSYKASFLSNDTSGMPMVTMGCVSGKYRINLGALKRYNGEYKKQHLLRPGDIFIATRDVTQDRVLIGSPAIIPKALGEAICATNLYKVILKEDISTEFLYQLMRTSRYREQIIANAKGSTIVMLTKDSILNYKFKVDFKSEAYHYYIVKAETIRQKIDKNSEENLTLATLRDSLLPRLISGKIKV